MRITTLNQFQDEKELLFKSMLKHFAFEEIVSNKRGHKLGEMEKLVENKINTSYMMFRADNVEQESVVNKFIPFDGTGTEEQKIWQLLYYPYLYHLYIHKLKNKYLHFFGDILCFFLRLHYCNL